MPEFVNLAPDIYRLRVPFSGTWTGVVLVRGTQNVLIDSAASASDVDNYIVPALKKLGMSLVGRLSYAGSSALINPLPTCSASK